MIRTHLSLLLALSLLASACGGGGQVVARVDGTEIRLSEVAELRLEPSVEAGSEQFLNDLFRLVASEALAQAAEAEFGLTVSEERIAEAEERIRVQIEEAGGTVEELLASQGYAEAMVRRVAYERALRELIEEQILAAQERPTEDEARDLYQARLVDFATVCTHHVLVETEEEAVEVKERLEDGEPLAEVADEVSLDQGSEGGELGCHLASVFVPEFAAAVLTAPVGELTGPIHSQFGWHVVVVESREIAPFEEAEGRVVEEIMASAAQERFREFVNRALLEADIEVEPRFGRWVTDPGPAIVPPAPEE